MNIVPIINENDTVSIDEIMFGDNDILASKVAAMMDADLLILLTDTEGLFDNNPKVNKKARLISSLDEKSFDTDFINDIKSEVSFGGMTSKINAALDVSKFGIPTIIANGKTKSVLRDIFNLKDVGTAIVPSSIKLKSRKKWIGMGPRSSGRLFLDSGAANAIINNRKSLLPSGVLKIEGSFQKGQQVICVRESDNSPIARGLISYSSDEINQIKGRKSSEIEKILGYKYSDEIINRDNMVLI